MLDAATKQQLRQAYRTSMMIGLAMLWSLLVYAAMVELLRWNLAPFKGFAPFPAVDILRYVFLALSVADFFLIRFLRNRILSGKLNVQQAPSPPRGSSEQIQRLRVASVVTYALCESVAIYGLILFLIAGSRSDFYGFLVLSAVLYAVYFPRYGQWEQWVHEQERGHST